MQNKKAVIKKSVIFSLTALLVYGVWWLFSPLLNVKSKIFWYKVNIGEEKTYSDYYYAEIGGITYIKDKFYVLLNKPYLLEVGRGYVYSSFDLRIWSEEAAQHGIPSASFSLYDNDRYHIDSNGYTIWKSNNSNISNYSLPREINNNCYIVVFQSGFISPNCDGTWKSYDFLTDIEKNLVSKSESITADNTLLTDGKICKLYQQGILKEKLLESIYCAPKLSLANINAYHVLYKIVQTNKLDIILDGSHTAYGGGKYVGVFYKNKQYYFIISTDGIHYEIKPAPSELVSSLAINLFK